MNLTKKRSVIVGSTRNYSRIIKKWNNKLPEGITYNEDGNPIWVDPDENEVKPIDKFKVDKPDKEFQDDMDELNNQEEKKVRGQMRGIEQGYAAKDNPSFYEGTEYLNDFQGKDNGLPYSKVISKADRFTYAIHKPKKERGKQVSHVEPVNCKGHKWHGETYSHNPDGATQSPFVGLKKALRNKGKS